MPVDWSKAAGERPRAFITGLTGFVGPYLAELLTGDGFQVAGLGMPAALGVPLPPGVSLIECDIRDAELLKAKLREFRPHYVFHLAAIANVPASFKDPRLTYDVNVGGTLNLLECLRESELSPRIVHVSTAHVYGSLDGGEACFDEESPVRLLSPYVASKYMCEALVKHYVQTFGIEIVIARPFNHVGPGQAPTFVCSDFARQFALMRRQHMPAVLRTGNLEAARDFSDVRDVVRAYLTLAAKGQPGEIYNICSGTLHSIGEVVAMLAEVSGVAAKVEVSQDKLRAVEVTRLRGNCDKLKALGWAPEIPLKQSLRDIFEFWEEQFSVVGCEL